MKTIVLNGPWEYKAVNPPGDQPRVRRWSQCTVPGTIHTDLLANGVIEDPYYRANEFDVQWVESCGWHYRRTFTLTEEFVHERHVVLIAEGLDTYATIRINGRVVGTTENMFIAHRFDVKRFLKAGRNSIEILFDSPVSRSKALERKFGALNVALEPHRVYVRKAQYSFSWDWGPKLTTSGIWRDICLQAWSGARLRDPLVRTIELDKHSALVELSVELEGGGGNRSRVRTTVTGEGCRIEREMQLNDGRAAIRVRIPRPQLWWPNGYGEQPLYSARFTLVRGDQSVDRTETTFALRTVRLLQERDEQGKSFVFEINGVKIFCKGADWIPSDNFLPRIGEGTYETLLLRAKQAHMNMIRVWGGGIYERDTFYELCDRLGLMVWQDFMFACGEYPDHSSFIRQVKMEAEQVVRRLRNHPSLVVWCGNNECEWLYCTEHPDGTADDMTGARIFRETLPAVCDTLDGTRPYWRSSPFGSGFPNAESNGNHHQWMVWSFWKDFPEYEKDNARFVTEFGFQAPANRRTFEEVTLLADRHPQSRVMEHHNKQVEGTERLLRFMAAHYLLGNSFDDFVYTGQLVQADALKCAVEHWRRRKFGTAGALFWQLNDCWPVSSWSVIDSALRPKAAWFAAKRFYAPVLLSFKRDDGGIGCWITNDLLSHVSGKIEFELLSFSGKVHWKRAIRVTVGANRSTLCWKIPGRLLAKLNPRGLYLVGRLLSTDGVVSENRQFFAEPKHWEKVPGKVAVRVSEVRPGEYRFALRSSVFAKAVRIEIDGEDAELQDNYLDLDPRRERSVIVRTRLSLNEVRKRIRLRWI